MKSLWFLSRLWINLAQIKKSKFLWLKLHIQYFLTIDPDFFTFLFGYQAIDNCEKYCSGVPIDYDRKWMDIKNF